MRYERLIVCVFCLLSVVLALPSFGGGVKMNQTIELEQGWNAVYVRVGPEEPAEVLFKNWPVTWVALYDPADHLTTRQYDKSSDTEGTLLPGYRVWRKGKRTVSSFRYVPANSILIAYATKKHTCVFCGTPVAPRIDWHDASAQGTMNLVGISADEDAIVTTDGYFSGLGLPDDAFYRLTITGKPDKPRILPVSIGESSWLTHFDDGDVVLVNSGRSRDWNGVLSVFPSDGIDFGTELKMAQLEVRNDSASDRTVLVTLRRGVKHGKEPAPDVPPLYRRDAYAVVTNEAWTETLVDMPFTNRIEVGDSCRLQFAVDRSQCKAPTGTVYGVIAEIRDVTPAVTDGIFTLTNESGFVAYVPITMTVGAPDAESSKLIRNGGVWPTGLWVAVADLDTVTRIGNAVEYGGKQTREVPSGGTMRVRLPVWADVDDQGRGELWLLQRFSYGFATNGSLRVFSGAITEADEPIVDLKRCSTPFLPTDQPEIAFEKGSVFGTAAVAQFVVGERSPVNPMRHAQHPNHDGLAADYSGNAPSGDNLKNYVSTVKPETFSITNRLAFAWDEKEKAGWDPTETLTGHLVWEFDGLRHKEGEQSGTIRAQGKFTMKYISPGPVRLKR